MSFIALKDINYSTILKVSTPTILSALSTNIMQIMDRLILAKYSTTAMTSATASGVWCGTIQCATISMIFIAGAFVGNYNGAGKYKLAGVPVWQMIWFSLFLFLLSIPMSKYLGPYCVPTNLQADGIPYFEILMAWTPIFCLKASISLFFIAIGKGFLITIAVLIAMVINFIADIVLVFGCFGITQFMGTPGAAIGTILAELSEVVFLSICFFKKNIRQQYGTLNCKLRLKRLNKYLKLGFLASIGHIVESVIFSFIVFFLTSISNEMALIQTISSTLYSFFLFFVSGLEKGIMSIASNLLGAKMRCKIDILLKRGIVLHCVITLIISAFIFIYPSIFINSFIDMNSASHELINEIILVMGLMMITFLFDGVVWIEAGILEAGGDVNFMMATIAGCITAFVAIPAGFLIYSNTFSVEWDWILYSLSSVIASIILLKHYRSNKWIHINV